MLIKVDVMKIKPVSRIVSSGNRLQFLSMYLSLPNLLPGQSVVFARSSVFLWMFWLKGIMKSSKSNSRDKSSFRLSIFDINWLVVGGFPQTLDRQTSHKKSRIERQLLEFLHCFSYGNLEIRYTAQISHKMYMNQKFLVVKLQLEKTAINNLCKASRCQYIVRPTVFGTKVISTVLVFPVVMLVLCMIMLFDSF